MPCCFFDDRNESLLVEAVSTVKEYGSLIHSNCYLTTARCARASGAGRSNHHHNYEGAGH